MARTLPAASSTKPAFSRISGPLEIIDGHQPAGNWRKIAITLIDLGNF